MPLLPRNNCAFTEWELRQLGYCLRHHTFRPQEVIPYEPTRIVLVDHSSAGHRINSFEPEWLRRRPQRRRHSPTPTSPTPASKIQHVVIIFQENRTPDNLFQDPVLIKRGADIQNYGINSQGQEITLGQIDLGTVGANPDNYDLSHAHSAFLAMYDNGKMDGADLIHYSCATGVSNCAPPNPQFMYVNPADVAPYFQIAEHYTFNDRMFQTNQGPSFPAHQFIISGTSAPAVGSNLFVEENTRRRYGRGEQHRLLGSAS